MSRTKRRKNMHKSYFLSEEDFNVYLSAYKKLCDVFHNIISEINTERKKYYKIIDSIRKVSYIKFCYLSYREREEIINNLTTPHYNNFCDKEKEIIAKYNTNEEEIKLCKLYNRYCRNCTSYEEYVKKENNFWSSDKHSGFWNCPKHFRQVLNRTYRAKTKNKLKNAIIRDEFDDLILDKNISTANWIWF